MTPRIFWFLMAISTVAHVVFVFAYKTHPGIDGLIYQNVAQNINGADNWLACGAFSGAYWPPLFCIYLAAFYKIFGIDSGTIFFLLNIPVLMNLKISIHILKVFGKSQFPTNRLYATH